MESLIFSRLSRLQQFLTIILSVLLILDVLLFLPLVAALFTSGPVRAWAGIATVSVFCLTVAVFHVAERVQLFERLDELEKEIKCEKQ